MCIKRAKEEEIGRDRVLNRVTAVESRVASDLSDGREEFASENTSISRMGISLEALRRRYNGTPIGGKHRVSSRRRGRGYAQSYIYIGIAISKLRPSNLVSIYPRVARA